MSLPVVLSPEAGREFDAAADWYEQQSGIGLEFTTRVREALEVIGQEPERHQVVYREIRRARARPFPYHVYYRARADRVEVIAILHGRRDPSAWKTRT